MFEGDQVPFVLTAGIFLRKNPEPVDCHDSDLPSKLERTRSYVPPLSIVPDWNRHGGSDFTTATLEVRRTAPTGCGEAMTYVLLAFATVFAIGVSSARADPISTFQVTDATMFMGPNRGDGNVRFTFIGPGLDVEGFGGMACFSWCSGTAIPLDARTDLTQIFVGNFTTAVLGGVAYSADFELIMGDPPFFDASGGLNPIAMGFVGSGPTFSAFRMLLPTGSWSLNFEPAQEDNGNPARRFVNGTFSASALTPTPEPGTFGLLLAGSAGIGWITRRPRKFRDV
jgi:hypothetical protein